MNIGLVVDIIVVVGVAAILFAVFRSLRRHKKEQESMRELLKTGEAAEAKILRMWDTGSSFNNNPKLGLELEVSPPGRDAYQIYTYSVVSRVKLSQVQTGNIVAVKIDPLDKTRVALDLP